VFCETFLSQVKESQVKKVRTTVAASPLFSAIEEIKPVIDHIVMQWKRRITNDLILGGTENYRYHRK
jgi:hypothetical protein